MTTAEILNAAADLIEPEGRWAQGYYAFDAEDEIVEPLDASAVRWCALGAIDRVSDGGATGVGAHLAFVHSLGVDGCVNWNDAAGRTQPEVVQALRDAAKAAS